MTGLLASLITLQMTFGPHSLAHDQALITTRGFRLIEMSLYLPANAMCEWASPVDAVFDEIDRQYRQLLPRRHAPWDNRFTPAKGELRPMGIGHMRDGTPYLRFEIRAAR